MARSLGSYLLLPRPGDAIKWWIMPVTFAWGAVAVGGVTDVTLFRAVVAWVVLELLVYQARYQWNDIRGFDADQRHPDRDERGRLPGPMSSKRRSVASSWATIAVRLAAAALLVLALPELGLGGWAFVVTVAVFGIAIGYEALRSVGTGWSDGIPRRIAPGVVGIWLVIGGGYAIRGLAGLSIALDLGANPALAGAAALTCWAAGIAFVTGRWAIESLAFADAGRDGRVTWRVRADHAREHLTSLARWLPERVPHDVDGTASVRTWAALSGRTSLAAPWNVAFLAGAAGAAAMGFLASDTRPWATAIAVGIGSVAALSVMRAQDRRAGRVVLGAVALAGWALVVGIPVAAQAALPWAFVAFSHASSTTQSLATMGGDLPRRRRITRTARANS